MNMSTTIPKPNVNVSRSRTVTGRSLGTVSSSGADISRSTRWPPTSGSHRSTGSSRAMRPWSTRAMVVTPVTTLVVEAMRKSESGRTPTPADPADPTDPTDPTVSWPSASVWTWSPLAIRATRPGTLSGPTCDAAISEKRPSPSRVGASGTGVGPVEPELRAVRIGHDGHSAIGAVERLHQHGATEGTHLGHRRIGVLDGPVHPPARRVVVVAADVQDAGHRHRRAGRIADGDVVHSTALERVGLPPEGRAVEGDTAVEVGGVQLEPRRG